MRKCSKKLERLKSGGIRLQYSVYEFNNSARILGNVKEIIKSKFSKLFTLDDSVLIFEASDKNIIKMGNAIHRDKDVLFFD